MYDEYSKAMKRDIFFNEQYISVKSHLRTIFITYWVLNSDNGKAGVSERMFKVNLIAVDFSSLFEYITHFHLVGSEISAWW